MVSTKTLLLKHYYRRQGTGTPQNNRWDKFWTNLGFGAFLNAVRGKRFRKHLKHRLHSDRRVTLLFDEADRVFRMWQQWLPEMKTEASIVLR